MNQVLRGEGAKISSLSGVLVQKQAVQKGMVAIPFFNFCSGGCWWMLLLDYKKGGGKKPTKKFVCHPLLQRRKREKRREMPEVKQNTTIFALSFWCLKDGQEVVPPFWAPNLQLNTCKAFPANVGGSHFIGKAMLERGQKTKHNKMITVLGVFEFDALLSWVLGFLKMGGLVEGEAPPPPKKKMREAVLCQRCCCCWCCCCCCFVVLLFYGCLSCGVFVFVVFCCCFCFLNVSS